MIHNPEVSGQIPIALQAKKAEFNRPFFLSSTSYIKATGRISNREATRSTLSNEAYGEQRIISGTDRLYYQFGEEFKTPKKNWPVRLYYTIARD